MSDVAERLYEHARSLPPEERAAFVGQTCGRDPHLRNELVSLLEQAEAAEGFFELLSAAFFSESALMSSVEKVGDSAGERIAAIDGLAHSGGLVPGDTISHYRIVSRIGKGGMGTVYRAHDTRLDRAVALKFLSPHALAPLHSEERLFAEARAAAALEHPNVCVIHEIGEADDGQPFIAMAFYEGETLKERIKRGPLPVDEAVTIAAQITRGLAAAHAREIIHRDVKPGNVMLTTEGTAKVLDFGLAKVDDMTTSRSGMTPGTVAYMSPEQVHGDPVDRRTDLWSLGVVLYEMLSGVRPFRGGSEAALVHAILDEDVEPLSKRRPETPERLAQIVARLLRKERDKRYASAADLLADLPGALTSEAPASPRTPPARGRPAVLVGSVLVLVALTGAALWLAGRGEESIPAVTTPPGTTKRVLVAEFADFTSDSLLGDAVSRALGVDLARSPAVQLAGSASVADALRRMRREPGIRLTSELAREVAVRERIPVVIEGEVRRVGAGYVLSAALVEAATGEVVDGWREAARDSTAVIDAIDRLSAAIRGRLGESLTSLKTEEPLGYFTTHSLEALRKEAHAGRVFLAGDFLHAAALFEEATRLDSAFAKAYFGLGHALDVAGVRRRAAFEATIRAYQLRDHLSALERHAVTADYYWRVVGDLPKAIEALRDQIEAARPAGAQFPLQAALILYADLAHALILTGDLAGAEAAGREARVVFPTAFNQGYLVTALYRRGKASEAATVLAEVMQRYPDHPHLNAMRAEMVAASGDYDGADALARELSLGVGTGYGHRIQALNAAVRGRIADAIGHLRAMQQEQLSAGRVAEATEVSVAIGRLRLARGYPNAAVAEVEGVLASEPLDSLDSLDRPYFALARFYGELGHARRARQFLAAYESAVPRELQRPDRWMFLRARAAIRLGEGNPRAALADLERARREPPIGHYLQFDDAVIPLAERPELARAYERAGDPESAITTYERYLATHSIHRTELDAFELPDALLRLGRLYEARGNRSAAARQYLRFAELWKDADAELQPKVREARRRAADLTASREEARQRASNLSASRGTRATPR